MKIEVSNIQRRLQKKMGSPFPSLLLTILQNPFIYKTPWEKDPGDAHANWIFLYLDTAKTQVIWTQKVLDFSLRFENNKFCISFNFICSPYFKQ